MRTLALLIAVPLLLVALPSTASACTPPTVSDDGAHVVGQMGTVVTINLVGANLNCTFAGFRLAESWSEDVASPSCTPGISDDGTHSVSETSGTVTINDADVNAGCNGVRVYHPEVWVLP